jgi:CRISPR-associated exonuclease Cas4
MSEDDDLVPISALQHVVYCERQAALIHVERSWVDNQLTALGQIVHARADERGRDRRRGVRVERAVRLRSARLRLFGIADAIEWANGEARPVETKRGPVVERLADQVQLCAQGLCLEEMLTTRVDVGVLFYAATHRRVEVPLSAPLRERTEGASARMHQLLERAELPAPEFGPKCKRCSLEPICQPRTMKSARKYLEALFSPK